MSAKIYSAVPFLAAVASLGLSAMGCARSSPSEPRPSAASTAPAPASPSGSLDPCTYGWQAGQWYSYPLELSTAVSFAAGAKVFDFDLKGLLQVTPAWVTPDDVTLYVAVANPVIVSRIPKGQAALDEVAAQIGGTGCFFTLSGGRVTAMQAPGGLSTMASNTYREIGSALQFTHALPAANTYVAEEYDTTGQVVAEYERDPSADLWHKRKTRYIAILAAKTAPMGAPVRVVPHIDASEGTVRLTPDGHLRSADFRNDITIPGAQQPIHATTSLSLKEGPSEPAHQPPPDWNALMASMPRTPADEPLGSAATLSSLDAARIHGMTFDEAVADLERIAKEREDRVPSSVNGAPLADAEKGKQEHRTTDESRAFIALSAIVRDKPETVARVLRLIHAKSPASGALASVLSSASSPEAQSALVSLANDKTVTLEMRRQILMALSRTPAPDERSIQAMKALLKNDPFSEMGLLSLGTFCRRLRDAGRLDEANVLGDLLVERLGAAKFLSDRLTALRAITNSGYAPALARIEPLLNDGSPEIRAAAARALQSMRDPAVDGLLAERMQADAASDVRISAISAAKVRDPSDVLAHAVEGVAMGDQDPYVRYRAVDLLAAWVTSRLDARLALQRVAKSDSEVRIRDRAQGAL